MSDWLYLLAAALAGLAVTLAERALPFVCGDWLRRQRWALVIGDFLPPAVMALLALSSAAAAAAGRPGWPWPEACAIALTVVLQWFTRNSLLSIFSGTALYVFLINGPLL